MKHVGKMKNNNAKVVVAYRTLPGDSGNALVVGTNSLGESYHDSLINLVQEASAQDANEFADILAVRSFPDGSNMLQWLHGHGHLKKVPTDGVLMTPTPQTSLSLDQLNVMIAEQRGVSLDELAVTDGKRTNPKTKITEEKIAEPIAEDLTPVQMRAKADLLFQQAQKLRKDADVIDPPKSKVKKVSVIA